MKRSVCFLGPETEQVEYKKSTALMREAVISMAAILNRHGSGKLYFGVKNNGAVIGEEIGENHILMVRNAILRHLSPTVHPEIDRETYGSRTVLAVGFKGNCQPYFAYGIPRIRKGNRDLVMNDEEYREMLGMRDMFGYSWENRRSRYRICDIDRLAVDSYLTKAGEIGGMSFESTDPIGVIMKLELADGEHLLNAGAALFVNCGLNELRLEKYASDNCLTVRDSCQLEGHIIGLAELAVEYICETMEWRVVYDGSFAWKDIPEIPVKAVREAVINAFGHRDMNSTRGVEVKIYRSFIDICNPGSFPGGMTPEMYIWGDERPVRRNPLIMRALSCGKTKDGIATGLKRIWDACRETGCRVEFFVEEKGFRVRFYRRCEEEWGALYNAAAACAEPEVSHAIA